MFVGLSSVNEHSDQIDQRITRVVEHFEETVTGKKESKLTELDVFTQKLSFIIDELGTKVVQQGNTKKDMEESIIHLEKELLESNMKYQAALADVSTFAETIKPPKLVYEELSKEYDRDRSLLRGNIKVYEVNSNL